ncbi:MAG: HEAT repeat domain-containing protein [Planctomycetota bacterium]
MKKAMLLSLVLFTAMSVRAASLELGRAADLTALKDKLKAGVVQTLYYTDEELSPTLLALIETRGNDDVLIDVYRSLDDEEIYLRHTILIALIKKQQRDLYNSGDSENAQDLLVSALKDDHFWIRTEAAWGLRFFGEASLVRPVLPLLEDDSDYVRKEARETLMELYELYQDRNDNVF